MVPAVSVPLSVKVGGLISTLAFGFAAGTVVQAASLTTAIITTLIAVIGLAWTISKANKRNVQAAELELRTARAEARSEGIKDTTERLQPWLDDARRDRDNLREELRGCRAEIDRLRTRA
jgi:hypothetical protein